MMPKIRDLETPGRWGVGDAVVFWLKSVAQWVWQPLQRGAVFVFYYGVPPPVMVFPDSRGTPAQFPPLSSIGFDFAYGAALPVWHENDPGLDRLQADPASPDSDLEQVEDGVSEA